jgi:hypothetical protein
MRLRNSANLRPQALRLGSGPWPGAGRHPHQSDSGRSQFLRYAPAPQPVPDVSAPSPGAEIAGIIEGVGANVRISLGHRVVAHVGGNDAAKGGHQGENAVLIPR